MQVDSSPKLQWHITETGVLKLFLQHEFYLGNEAATDHLPSSFCNMLLKIKPFLMHTVLQFSLYSALSFLLIWILLNQIQLFTLAWKQIGSGMLGPVNKQDVQCEHNVFEQRGPLGHQQFPVSQPKQDGALERGGHKGVEQKLFHCLA